MAALHDVSKHDDTRLDPKANASDTRAQRDATNTTSIHPVTDATTTAGFLQTGSGRILGNDGAHNIGLFGFDSNGQMVIKVAKPGFDADTASDDELVFNSGQNVFKIVNILTGTLAAVTSNPGAGNYGFNFQTLNLNHGQSFKPAFIAYYQTGTTYGILPWSFFGNASASSAYWVTINVISTSTIINFQLSMMSFGMNISAGPFNVKVYVLQETAD